MDMTEYIYQAQYCVRAILCCLRVYLAGVNNLAIVGQMSLFIYPQIDVTVF